MSDKAPYAEFSMLLKNKLSDILPGMTQTELADKLSTKQGYISKILRGERLPSDDIVNRLKDVFSIDIKDAVAEAKKNRDLLIRGLLDRTGQSTYYDEDTEGLYINNQPKKPRIPVKVAAGQISEYYSGIYESMCEKHPIIRQFQYYDFTMIVQGNSMEPKYEGGDEIACVKVNKTIRWGEVYVLDTSDGAFLKRVYDDGDRVRCVSYNKEYPDFYVDKTDIVGMYRIVGLLRYNH